MPSQFLIDASTNAVAEQTEKTGTRRRRSDKFQNWNFQDQHPFTLLSLIIDKRAIKAYIYDYFRGNFKEFGGAIKALI